MGFVLKYFKKKKKMKQIQQILIFTESGLVPSTSLSTLGYT